MNTPNFDRLARVYRWMELASFGPFLWWCRCAFLPQMAAARRALIIGDGDGRFTAKLFSSNPLVAVDAVDASGKMLGALAHRSAPHADRLRTFALDARNLNSAQLFAGPAGDAESRYDLIVTHFFLDCLTTEEIRELVFALRPCLSQDAQWVVSEFTIPARGMRRYIAGFLVRLLYQAFGVLTGLRIRRLPEYESALLSAGFGRIRQRRWLGGLLVSELWSLHSRF